MSIRILLVDDHKIVREGLKLLLQSRPDMHVVGEASDGAEGVCKAEELAPDLVILDVNMPQMNGFEAARAIRTKVPQMKILMLTQHDVPQMLEEAMRAGADGLVLKSDAPQRLFAAIQTVLEKTAVDDQRPCSQLRLIEESEIL